MKTVFLRVLEADDKGAALLAAVREPERANGRQRFDVDPAAFDQVPGSPFAYWVGDRVRSVYGTNIPFEHSQRIVRQGGVTGNDARFLRLHWEVPMVRAPQMDQSWVPFAKCSRHNNLTIFVKCVLVGHAG